LAERYAACGHVVTLRHGRTVGPVDDALAAMGLVRSTAVVVPSFSTALSIAAATDLVALIPSSYFEHLRARACCARSRCRCPRSRSPCRRCGIRVWIGILRISGCAGMVQEICRPLNERTSVP
jgi:DNA-binding transcriptional LysR family regulator